MLRTQNPASDFQNLLEEPFGLHVLALGILDAGQSLAARRRVLGLEHRDTLRSMNNLARLYVEEGKYTQAEA